MTLDLSKLEALERGFRLTYREARAYRALRIALDGLEVAREDLLDDAYKDGAGRVDAAIAKALEAL